MDDGWLDRLERQAHEAMSSPYWRYNDAEVASAFLKLIAEIRRLRGELKAGKLTDLLARAVAGTESTCCKGRYRGSLGPHQSLNDIYVHADDCWWMEAQKYLEGDHEPDC